VVSSGADEDDVAPALLGGNLREVLGQADHHRHARGVVERGVIVAVHVRHDVDLLVGRTGERREDTGAHEPLSPLDVELGGDRHGFA